MFFAFTAFTRRDKLLKIKVLSMKAKPVKEVKDETPLAFTRNSLSLWDLVLRAKAVKAKCKPIV